jgi:hypothetical protein
MAENFLSSAGTPTLPGRLGITWDHVQLFDLRPEGTYDFSFALVGDAETTPTEAGPSPLRFILDLFWVRKSPPPLDARTYPVKLQVEMRGSSLARELFPIDRRFLEKHEFQANDEGYVVLPDALVADLRAWAEAKRGFPSRTSGSYSRMLYLSAVTITTVGLGDILPISNRARLAVAAEAVMGVVLIGLFLNALAAKMARRG